MAKFEKEEVILAHHQNMMYEAKILNLEERIDPTNPGAKKPYFFIHYVGWNDRWDEWVDDSRLLKHNEENLAIQLKINENKVPNKKKRRKKILQVICLTTVLVVMVAVVISTIIVINHHHHHP